MDARAPRDGRALETLGWYDPIPNPPRLSVNKERVLHWLRHGAQPSEAVRWILEKEGVWQAFVGEPDNQAATEPGAATPPAPEPDTTDA